jgi:hypothetical protein
MDYELLFALFMLFYMAPKSLSCRNWVRQGLKCGVSCDSPPLFIFAPHAMILGIYVPKQLGYIKLQAFWRISDMGRVTGECVKDTLYPVAGFLKNGGLAQVLE